MCATVVDASAIAAILFGEEQGRDIVGRIAGVDLIAPLLIDYELANVCLVKTRRNPDNVDAITDSWRSRHALRISRLSVDVDHVVAVARTFGLTAYDAAYLALALDANAELVTLDNALARAVALSRM